MRNGFFKDDDMHNILMVIDDMFAPLFEDERLAESKMQFLKKSVPYKIENENDKIIISIEMPGVEENDLSISFVKNRKLEVKAKCSSKIRNGDIEWSHVFESIDPTKIEAKLANGVLTVVLNKKEDEVVKINISK